MGTDFADILSRPWSFQVLDVRLTGKPTSKQRMRALHSPLTLLFFRYLLFIVPHYNSLTKTILASMSAAELFTFGVLVQYTFLNQNWAVVRTSRKLTLDLSIN